MQGSYHLNGLEGPTPQSKFKRLQLFHALDDRIQLFCGVIPNSISKLSLLDEVDLSNNRFVGPFPTTAISLPKLKYLDTRYNEFEGPQQLPLWLFPVTNSQAVYRAALAIWETP
ncbi:hypothetical protein Patl1_09045 [Pistacia atlantica]|uniref:Uncharacterized protein n=1 Tax=Pistacia atlantica TaxID=434234 RepID=A0ACC1AFW3_9ROSI|nr:hypothetical protein Patl1_09045 [Pistacia atlantica]